MEVKVFVPAGELNSAGLVNVYLEILLASVPQMAGVSRAVENLKGKVYGYDRDKKAIQASLPPTVTLAELQDALGSGYKLKLDSNLGAYDEKSAFDALLNVACAKEAAAAAQQLASLKPSL